MAWATELEVGEDLRTRQYFRTVHPWLPPTLDCSCGDEQDSLVL